MLVCSCELSRHSTTTVRYIEKFLIQHWIHVHSLTPMSCSTAFKHINISMHYACIYIYIYVRVYLYSTVYITVSTFTSCPTSSRWCLLDFSLSIAEKPGKTLQLQPRHHAGTRRFVIGGLYHGIPSVHKLALSRGVARPTTSCKGPTCRGSDASQSLHRATWFKAVARS